MRAAQKLAGHGGRLLFRNGFACPSRSVGLNSDVDQTVAYQLERLASCAVYICVPSDLEGCKMSDNVIKFPGKRVQASFSEKREQELDEVKELVTDDLREQLLEECRRKHGFAEKKRE
jgi:hypothetical protein